MAERRSRPKAGWAREPRRRTIYFFKVSFHRRKDIYRTIAVGSDSTLDDLHLAIQEAFGWDADHLYSFFLSGEEWDSETEYTLLNRESMVECDLPPSRDTRRARVRDLGIEVGAKFLYLFDYGDCHVFAVELIEKDKQVIKGGLPFVVDQRGRSPEQYPDVPE
jgi:hypothetical protein